jgi:hypothetical protein
MDRKQSTEFTSLNPRSVFEKMAKQFDEEVKNCYDSFSQLPLNRPEDLQSLEDKKVHYDALRAKKYIIDELLRDLNNYETPLNLRLTGFIDKWQKHTNNNPFIVNLLEILVIIRDNEKIKADKDELESIKADLKLKYRDADSTDKAGIMQELKDVMNELSKISMELLRIDEKEIIARLANDDLSGKKSCKNCIHRKKANYEGFCLGLSPCDKWALDPKKLNKQSYA